MSWNIFANVASFYYSEKKPLTYQKPVPPKVTQNDDLNHVIKTSPTLSATSEHPENVIEHMDLSISGSTEGSVVI